MFQQDTSSSEISIEDIMDFEIPVLQRRNGVRFDDQFQIEYLEKQWIQIPSPKIYKDQNCPICLNENTNNLPLICGHVFCQEDTEILIHNSQQHTFACPLCRQIQKIESLQQLKDQRSLLNIVN